METSNNPLNHLFRKTGTYTSLPSGMAYYDSGVIEFSEDGEVAIKPMTTVDELNLKNPDSLLNGKAVSDMLMSCVSGLKKPEELLQCDVETLIIAIRKETYGKTMETHVDCPKCNKNNKYEIDLELISATAKPLEPEYKLQMRQGLTVQVKPYTFGNQIKANKIAFEQMKIAKTMENADEESRLSVFNNSFNEITNLNFELIANSIIQIEANDIGEPVTNKDHISEFIRNISASEEKLIEDLVAEINKLGVDKEVAAVCDECKHEWNFDMSFDPTTFFTNS